MSEVNRGWPWAFRSLKHPVDPNGAGKVGQGIFGHLVIDGHQALRHGIPVLPLDTGCTRLHHALRGFDGVTQVGERHRRFEDGHAVGAVALLLSLSLLLLLFAAVVVGCCLLLLLLSAAVVYCLLLLLVCLFVCLLACLVRLFGSFC